MIYEVIGKLILKAMVSRITIPLQFPTFFYRYLLEDSIDADNHQWYKEVYEVDPEFASNVDSIDHKFWEDFLSNSSVNYLQIISKKC
jgi:hypothetical protein